MSDPRSTTPPLPPVLRDRVARDLRPVRPLAEPWRRALALLPVALMLLLFVVTVYGLRRDLPQLGAAGWGLSSIEIAAGLFFAAVALTEAIPGRRISTRTIAATFTLGCALVAAVTLLTTRISPSGMPPARAVDFLEYCLGRSALAGIPAVIVAAGLAARALPVRPLLVGALYGFAAGLFADSGWRLFCAVSAPSHVLLAHGGAIGALTIAGAATSRIAAALRARRLP